MYLQVRTRICRKYPYIWYIGRTSATVHDSWSIAAAGTWTGIVFSYHRNTWLI